MLSLFDGWGLSPQPPSSHGGHPPSGPLPCFPPFLVEQIPFGPANVNFLSFLASNLRMFDIAESFYYSEIFLE